MYAVIKKKLNKISLGARKNKTGYYSSPNPAVFSKQEAKQIVLIPKFKDFQIVPYQEVVNQRVK